MSRKFVSDKGTDLCVLCGADTGIPAETPIDQRVGYVEGSGQICRKCEGAVIKAETLLERQQRGYLDCASKIPGVPCQK